MNGNIKSYTHVALVLDASGSMSWMEKSTIETMRKFFDSLKSPEDKTMVDVWQFSDRARHLVDNQDIESGAGAAIEHYHTGGCTALYDAICIGIDELGAKFAAMPEDDRPDAIVFAILTDGLENSSRRFRVEDVKSRIEHQSSKYSWEFRFLAANQDAVLTGSDMGIGADMCVNMEATPAGISGAVRYMADCVCCSTRGEARMKRAEKRARAPRKDK